MDRTTADNVKALLKEALPHDVGVFRWADSVEAMDFWIEINFEDASGPAEDSWFTIFKIAGDHGLTVTEAACSDDGIQLTSD